MTRFQFTNAHRAAYLAGLRSLQFQLSALQSFGVSPVVLQDATTRLRVAETTAEFLGTWSSPTDYRLAFRALTTAAKTMEATLRVARASVVERCEREEAVTH